MQLRGSIETPWGKGFRRYAECLAHIKSSDIQAPEGGLALPLRYTIFDAPSYSVVPSNAIWKDPERKAEAAKLAKDERDNARRSLYFPQIMRDARRIPEYYPFVAKLSGMHGQTGAILGLRESQCQNFYDSEEVRSVFYAEMEQLLLEFFPDARDALVFNHDVFDKDYEGDRTEDQDAKNPGVNANYANWCTTI